MGGVFRYWCMRICGDRKRGDCNSHKLHHIQQAEYGISARAHWGIENSLHRVPDIAFREDESWIRAGNAAENMNMARHIGINLLKQEKSCKMGIASKRKKCGYDMEYLFKVPSGLNTGIE